MALATRKDVRQVRSTVGFRDAMTSGSASEAGIGALMPWANKLWITTYPAENGNATGTGLWSMDEDGDVELVAETNACHAGRLISGDYAFIGQHKIHRDGTVTALTGFASDDRIAAWAKHPGGPSPYYLYALTMGGKVYRVALAGTAVTQVVDAKTGLGIGSQAHFKAAWGTAGRLYVVCNRNANVWRLGYVTFASLDTTPAWTRLETVGDSFIEVAGAYYHQEEYAWATGQNGDVGFLYLIDGVDVGTARRFLLPLSSEQQAESYQQEWMRIRQTDTERFLMGFHGCYYALSPVLTGTDTFATSFPRIEPLARHSRTTTDFAVFNGKLWLGGNQQSIQGGNQFPNGGQAQSIFMSVDSTDHLIAVGRKPRGRGYWQKGAALAIVETDPMLARGYDKKTIYIKSGSGTATFTVNLFFGDVKQAWPTTIAVTGGTLAYLTLPDGVNPDWISLTPAGGSSTGTTSMWMDVS